MFVARSELFSLGTKLLLLLTFYRFRETFTVDYTSTLGAIGLSCAVSGLGQCLYCDPREKPLEKSAVSLIAPSQWETCLNQFSPAFGLDSRLAPIDLPRVLCPNRLFDWFQE